MASLRDPEQPLIWLDLQAVDVSDDVAVGDALSDAVRTGLGAPLFGTGAEASYGLAVLESHLSVLEPISFAVTNAHLSPTWTVRFAAAIRAPNLLVVQVPPDYDTHTICSAGSLVRQDDIAIGDEEALDLFGDERPTGEILTAVLENEGAIDSVEEALGLMTWSGDGMSGAGSAESGDDARAPGPEAGVDAFILRRRWIEALELAARQAPTRIPEVVEEAGHRSFDTGQFKRFWRVISLVPNWTLRDERVMYWRFSASVTVNKWRSLLPAVDQYLERREAPELRALRATIENRADSVSQARRAYEALPNAVTASALGFLLTVDGDLPNALLLLKEAMGFAERAGRPRLVVSVAGNIALAHLSAGQYVRAQYWANWALREFHTVGLREELLRLSAVNFAAYTSLLTGSVASAEQALSTVQVREDILGVPTTEGILSTLGDLSLVKGEKSKALEYYRLIASMASRTQLPTAANDLVRCFLLLDESDRAIEVANEAVATAGDESPAHERVARLALGCALGAVAHRDAESLLASSAQAFSDRPFGAYCAQAAIHLGLYLLRTDRPDEARAVMEEHARFLSELGDSGWLLLGGEGPEVAQLKALFRTGEPELQIRLLGKRVLRRGAEETGLSLRFAELVAVLAANPSGVRGEQLGLALYGDRANPSTLKATISRARKVLPIEQLPYRIGEPYEADFVKVLELLGEGKVQAALELYRGPLLPESEAPAVVELREHLEESLRQAVLLSGDADAMIDLATQQGDDLELWEETRRHLPPNDPRRPLANARIRRIRRGWQTDLH